MLNSLKSTVWTITRSIASGLWSGRTTVSASIFDQAILSAANVGIGFLLIWFSNPSEYGTYVLTFGVLVTLQAIQSSLLTGPMTVYASTKNSHELRSYAGSALRIQAALCCLIAALVMVAASIAAYLDAPRSMQMALWAMACASPTIQLQEFLRRLMIARLMMIKVLANDLLHISLRAICLILLATLYPDMSMGLMAWQVFLVYLIASAVASLFGLAQSRILIGRPRTGIRPILHQHWVFGRWLIVSAMVTLVYGQGIYFYLAGVSGEEAVARLEGPRLIVAPCILLIIAWGNIVGPMAAKRYAEEGMSSVVAFVTRWATPLILGVVAYAIAVCMTASSILPMLLGPAYAQESTVVIAWAAVMVMMAISTAAASLFSASHRPALGTCCRVSGALAGLSGCVLFIDGADATGAVGARLLAETVITATAVALCLGLLKRDCVKEQTTSRATPVDLPVAG